MHPYILGFPLIFIANSSGTEINLASYEDRNGLPKNHRDADATAPNVETPAIRIIFVCSIKVYPPYAISLFS